MFASRREWSFGWEAGSAGLRLGTAKIIFSKPVELDLEKCLGGGGETNLILLAFLPFSLCRKRISIFDLLTFLTFEDYVKPVRFKSRCYGRK